MALLLSRGAWTATFAKIAKISHRAFAESRGRDFDVSSFPLVVFFLLCLSAQRVRSPHRRAACDVLIESPRCDCTIDDEIVTNAEGYKTLARSLADAIRSAAEGDKRRGRGNETGEIAWVNAVAFSSMGISIGKSN